MLFKKILRRFIMLTTDWRWWPFYFQRMFLNIEIRNHISNFVAKCLRPKAIHQSQLVEEWRAVSELQLQGIASLGQLLDIEKCQELRKYFETKPVYDPYRVHLPEFLPLNESARFEKSHIAHHQPADVLSAPYIIDLINSDKLLRIASDFLGCKPTVQYIAVWWSYNVKTGAQEAEFFHRDVDDWRFLKLFIYLDDVLAENGPHVYVKNSSKSSKLTMIRRFSDEEVLASFGEDNINHMTGSAGQAFLEDTFGIHKGQPVQNGRRIILQAVYGYANLPYAPSKPILKKKIIEQHKLDAWINRVYFG